VAEHVGINFLLDTGVACGVLASVARRLGINGLISAVPAIAGKQPGTGFSAQTPWGSLLHHEPRILFDSYSPAPNEKPIWFIRRSPELRRETLPREADPLVLARWEFLVRGNNEYGRQIEPGYQADGFPLWSHSSHSSERPPGDQSEL
jgi:hypothetical protein